MDYLRFTLHTKKLLHELAALQPKTLAAMHGSTCFPVESTMADSKNQIASYSERPYIDPLRV